MGEDPAAIREQIEHTRERMGDTVDALGYKADVPSRAKESVTAKVEGVKAKLTGAGSEISDATPGTQDVKQAGQQVVGVLQENPLGLAIGAAAVGFLVGMLIPSTKVEDEQLGPVADQVKDQVKQTGEDALERGKQVAQETAQTATESAKQAASDVTDKAQETAQQHAGELKSSAQDSAEEVKQRATRQPARALGAEAGVSAAPITETRRTSPPETPRNDPD
jgi:gas vesicle protein